MRPWALLSLLVPILLDPTSQYGEEVFMDGIRKRTRFGWKPVFTDEELDIIRALPTKRERKQAAAELRAKYLAAARGSNG